jgi:hypothetical protein
MTWRSENSCPHRDSNSDPLVVQPVASRCTDYAIPAMNDSLIKVFLSHIPILIEWKEREMARHYVPNDNGMRCNSRGVYQSLYTQACSISGNLLFVFRGCMES